MRGTISVVKTFQYPIDLNAFIKIREISLDAPSPLVVASPSTSAYAQVLSSVRSFGRL